MNITKQLPSLTELNITGNPAWLPGQHIRNLPNITVIHGISSYTMTYINHCIYCNLRKHADARQSTDVLSITYVCFKIIVSFRNNFTAIWSSNFTTTCQVTESHIGICKQTRRINETSSHRSVDVTDLCFEELNKWALHNVPIGLVAMAINFVVMATIILSTSLKKNVDMLLIANLAIGDFLQGLYLVTLTATYRSMSSS
jgi:hypothetical protein